ncbi:MAG: MBL fold metallo-hydrolase [Actinomycetota bacterium]
MSRREVVALGTASQVPTRHRSHQSLLLLLDDVGVLVDPGEGTQRQLTLAGIAASRIDAICITHLHGDHCLGLPGVVQRLSLDQVAHPVDLFVPEEGLPYVERLLHASVFEEHAEVRVRAIPADAEGAIGRIGAWTVVSHPLDHRIPCRGWRFEEPPVRHFDPVSLEARGIRGPAVGRLARDGTIEVDGRTTVLDVVSAVRPGQAVAVVMDTRECDGADRLAAGADLAVVESTFLSGAGDDELAAVSGHLTAAQAGRLASRTGVRRLVLTHFSQRHPDVAEFLAEASVHADDVVAMSDLDRVDVPPPVRADRPR